MPDETNLNDRVLQKAILTTLRGIYPSSAGGHELIGLIGQDERRFNFNLLYLQEHDLCEAQTKQIAQEKWIVARVKITAKGIDFLEDDGGLSAILGVVTVKIHAETIRELIAAKIETSPIPPAEKSALKKALAGLPGSALQAGTTDLVQAGLNHVPNFVEWIHSLVGFI
jgi:hypothetical protein